MKTLRATVIAVLLLGTIRSVWAYSPIWNVDGWDTNRLAEAGITVASWKHAQIGEDPPLNWVKVTYDSSKLPEDQNVFMTLWVTTTNGETICTCRAERNRGEAKEVTILLAVSQENVGSSRVEILVPKLHAAASTRDFGNPGFAGYSLHVSRIMELSRQSSANQVPEDTARKLADPQR